MGSTGPGFKLPQSFLEVESDRQFEFLREWQRSVSEAGYLGLDWPVEYTGGGDVQKRQRIVSQEIGRARAPFLVNVIGLQWAGPTILAHGKEEQKQRDLRPILAAEEIWCQGFSEPGAGSDLASVQTRAERTADGYRVTGHKVWTTLGMTRDDALERRQFDRPIGAFQAVKYPIVDMMVGVELARTHALAEAAALDHAPEGAEVPGRMAKAPASDVFATAVRKAVQRHGGYGFTWDCDVHLYFKRALASRATLGDATHHRRHLAEALLPA
jgi:alkylation response protein AidB-like acyl-CoA dehydrogenase